MFLQKGLENAPFLKIFLFRFTLFVYVYKSQHDVTV